MKRNTASAEHLAAELRRQTVRSRRRVYRLALVAGVAAIWATVATVVAWHHQQVVDPFREQSAAHANAERAIGTAEAVVSGLARRIAARSEQADPEMAEILAAAQKEFLALFEGSDDPIGPDRLRRNADLLVATSTSYLTLGDPGRAARAAAEGRDHLERLDQQFPEDRNKIAASYIAEGDALLALDDIEAAVAAYATASAIRGTLSAAAPENKALLRGLSIAYEREGQGLALLGATEQSGERLRQALAIRSQLAAAANENDLEALESLAIAHSNLGDRASRAGWPDEAIEHYGNALDVFARLEGVQPDNPAWQDAQAQHLARIGRAEAATGEYAAAFDTLDKAARTYLALIDAEPDNRRWQSRFADVMEWTGGLKLDRFDLSGARAAYTRALDIRRHHAERSSADTAEVRAFAGTLAALAKVDRAEHLDEVARLRLAEAIEARRTVLAAQPTNARAAAELAEALSAGAELGITPRLHLQEALDVLERFAQEEQLRREHEPLAEDIRQRLASFTQ